MANGNFGGGDGTEQNPFLIEDAYDFMAMDGGYSAHFKQVNDIDFSQVFFEPIRMFTGTFDGNMKKLKNIHLKTENIEEYGLAIFITMYYGNIKNIIVDNAIIDVEISDNAIAQYVDGKYCIFAVLVVQDYYSTFDNCLITGKINVKICDIDLHYGLPSVSAVGVSSTSAGSTYAKCGVDVDVYVELARLNVLFDEVDPYDFNGDCHLSISGFSASLSGSTVANCYVLGSLKSILTDITYPNTEHDFGQFSNYTISLIDTCVNSNIQNVFTAVTHYNLIDNVGDGYKTRLVAPLTVTQYGSNITAYYYDNDLLKDEQVIEYMGSSLMFGRSTEQMFKKETYEGWPFSTITTTKYIIRGVYSGYTFVIDSGTKPLHIENGLVNSTGTATISLYDPSDINFEHALQSVTIPAGQFPYYVEIRVSEITHSTYDVLDTDGSIVFSKNEESIVTIPQIWSINEGQSYPYFFTDSIVRVKCQSVALRHLQVRVARARTPQG